MSKVKHLQHTGLLGFLGGWLIIFLAISRNSWFVFTENAFSDLGNPAANDPWIFNFGMMLNGLLVLLYGLYLVYVSFNKRGSVGGAFMMITGVSFLALSGVFPREQGIIPSSLIGFSYRGIYLYSSGDWH